MTKPVDYRKFTNLHLTRGHVVRSHSGVFHAIVRLARPEYRPDYMTILGPYTPGYVRAEIGSDMLDHLAFDSNVLSVELREHLSMPPLH